MFSALRKEFKRTFRLSVPITIGLLGQGLFGVIDTVMIGNMLGEHALAAATLGNNINWVPLLLVIGITVAVPVLTAQARGAGTPAEIPGILRHGL
ncbi:MAG: oligosaccharide flippase family protein, partial [Opitutales bacterium]|nr:oligosaccharide flippase family protein [Opitutales bacterium]